MVLEEFDNRRKLLLVVVFLLSLSISGVRSLTDQHALGGAGGDGYQEVALIMQEKILNPSSNVSIAPYKPDEDLTIDRLKRYYLEGEDPVKLLEEIGYGWQTTEPTYKRNISKLTLSTNYKLGASPGYAPTRPFYPLIVALFNIVIGNIFVSSAVVNVIAVLLSLYIITLLVREYDFSHNVSFIAMIFFLSSSTTVTYLIGGATDYTALMLGMYSIYLLTKYFKTEKPKYVISYIFFATLTLFTREAFVFLSVLPIFGNFKRSTLFPRLLMITLPPIIFLLYLRSFDLLSLFIEVRILKGELFNITHPWERGLKFIVVNVLMCLSIYPLFLYHGLKHMSKKELFHNPLFVFMALYLTYTILSPGGSFEERILVSALLPMSIFSAQGVLEIFKRFAEKTEMAVTLTVLSILIFNYALAFIRIL